MKALVTGEVDGGLRALLLSRPAVVALARHEEIYKTERFSDHAPMTISYDFSGF